MLFIGMYLSSEFEFGSRIAFRLGASGEKRLQVLDKRTVRRLPLLSMCFSLEFRHRVPESTRRAQPYASIACLPWLLHSFLLCSSSFLGWHEEIFQPLVHAVAVFQRERSECSANELLLAMFRAEDIRVLRRGPLRVLTNPATKAPSWGRDAGFSTSERYAELDHYGPGGLSRHSPSWTRSPNLAFVQIEKIFL